MNLRKRKTSNRKQQKTTIKCFKASVLFAETKSQNLLAQVEKGLSMTQLILCHLKCTCRVTTSQDQAQSLNEDMTPKAWSKPINRVNKAAYRHDICYVKNKDTKLATKFVIKIC